VFISPAILATPVERVVIRAGTTASTAVRQAGLLRDGTQLNGAPVGQATL
jgi:putative ubiquitin-RnfH superfamily antitoxin RatB of RatAB toxin-antitoxin module